ncbi:hypothetical protein [Aquincola tertiaricarbonis]|uniref:hypothetical protein n=1 Tax=Aquincola tertiaricarbonis TaxID=391953 RepID=UPI000614ECB7|nr:hypothetical protein [Aquincola tertiaricarbonis]
MAIHTAMAGVEVAGFATSKIVQGIKLIYQVAGDLNDWLDRHIEALKASDRPVIACTGRVLEAAKFGFGLGYIASTVLIAAGQMLLGNTFAAVAAVGSAAVLSNPIAMTCGAVGAIYFGWTALTDKEREQILERLASGLTLGLELIRSIVEFSVRKFGELLDSKQAEASKKFIKDFAEAFGRSLYDITRQVGDFASDSAELIAQRTGQAAAAIKDAAGKVGDVVASSASAAGEAIKAGASRVGELASDAGKAVLKRAAAAPVMTTVATESPDSLKGIRPDDDKRR